MMVIVGTVAFYGFISLGVDANDKNLSKSDVRLATVVAIITFYLALVGTVSNYAPRAESSVSPEITTTLINHFTNIVGVVIAFYFGTEVYLAVQNQANKSNSEEPDTLGEALADQSPEEDQE